MASPALARITQLLDSKQLAGTLSRPIDDRRVCTSTGVDALDTKLAGGWPQGQLSEVVGPVSSGRTSVLLATLSQATRAGGVVALVDVADRLDPASAAEAGVVLDRVLWVRGAQATYGPARTAASRALADRAVQQGIRAFDLIARAGGFAVIACDVADVPASSLRALPAATWLRISHVLEGQTTAGLLVGAQPLGRSGGGVSIALRARGEWAGHSAQSRRLAGLTSSASVAQRVRRGAGACSFASYATR
jgi:recombination protein RecA